MKKGLRRCFAAAALGALAFLTAFLAGCGWFVKTVGTYCFIGDISDSLTLEFSFVFRPGATDPGVFTAESLEQIASEMDAQQNAEELEWRIEGGSLLIEKEKDGVVLYYLISPRKDENEYCIFSPVFRIGETDWFVPTHLLGVARDTFPESWEDESFPLVAGGRADVEAFYRRTNLYTVSPDEDGFTLTFQEGEEVYSMRVSFSEAEAGTTVAFSAI